MTGRLMKCRQIHGALLSIDLRLAWIRLLAFVLDADAAARHESQVTVGDHGVTGLNAVASTVSLALARFTVTGRISTVWSAPTKT